jgi:hypothetical protein
MLLMRMQAFGKAAPYAAFFSAGDLEREWRRRDSKFLSALATPRAARARGHFSWRKRR